MMRKRTWSWLGLLGLILLLNGLSLPGAAQTPPKKASNPSAQFMFDVVESFDSRYLGDTPGFIGRSGNLEGVRPKIYLGEPVYREKTVVGRVSEITWDRARDALTVQLSPEPLERIAVGDTLWLWLDGAEKHPNP